MKLKFLFNRLCDIETGGEGSAGGSGAIESVASEVIDQGAASAESAPKETMLDAITRGLDPAEKAAESGEGKAAEDRARDEGGRYTKKAAEDAATATDKPKPDAKPEAAKPGDEIAMPEGLSPKAQERFQALTTRLHESNARAQQVEADLNGFREVLKQTGGRPEDFAQAFDYISAVNKGDLKTALNLLDQQRRQISLAMGKSLPGADPLADFPDLRQRVEAYQLDENAAIELARSRQLQQQQQSNQQRAQQEQQQTNQQLAARSQAMSDVDKIAKEWAARDPDYDFKEDIILKQIPQIAQKFPPSMWATQVRILYDTLSAMPAPAQRINTPAPLRSSGQSGGARVPTSMLDALNTGLGYGN